MFNLIGTNLKNENQFQTQKYMCFVLSGKIHHKPFYLSR